MITVQGEIQKVPPKYLLGSRAPEPPYVNGAVVQECHLGALHRLAGDFSDEMYQKMEEKFFEGKTGWDDTDFRAEMEASIKKHAAKGDWLDVAILAAFLWNMEGVDNSDGAPKPVSRVQED